MVRTSRGWFVPMVFTALSLACSRNERMPASNSDVSARLEAIEDRLDSLDTTLRRLSLAPRVERVGPVTPVVNGKPDVDAPAPAEATGERATTEQAAAREKALAIVNRALTTTKKWTAVERDALRSIVSDLSAHDRDDILRGLARAINEDRLKPDGVGSPL